MLKDQDLQELLHFQAGSPVLSVYLNTDPDEGNADDYKLHLRNMLKDTVLPEDAEIAIRYFDLDHDWSGRGVALFSCADEGFFRSGSKISERC